ncbi:MAG: hypothetical protein M3R61_08120 [Chloroflexota bacterium]|nr:hypothetical protein [Chloroflexota bacterium]
MTIMIEIPPELEFQLRRAAAQAGLAPDDYIVQTLHERLSPQQSLPVDGQRLTGTEAQLLMHINDSLAGISWPRYHILIAKRQAEILTLDEQQELIAFSDAIETANVQRIQYVVELARLRNTTVAAVMQALGLNPVTHA